MIDMKTEMIPKRRAGMKKAKLGTPIKKEAAKVKRAQKTRTKNVKAK